MAFDLVILLLCTWRLFKSRRHSGIATLLLRDGIVSNCCLLLNYPDPPFPLFDSIMIFSLKIDPILQIYFVAAFGANLVQAVMAILQLNPVMNIIALPFALVVSVIAATTVFRNVRLFLLFICHPITFLPDLSYNY